MISVEGLKVEFNATPLFEDVSYVINKKDRIALVGKNGAGKSTMLKILAGIQQPTSGVVAVPRECTIGYLPQVMILSDERTVMQEAELAFEHIFEMQADIERMNQQLAERTDYDSEDYQKLIDRIYPEKKLVVGYSLGWDVLCTVMQFLPFTLGMVLIVTLGDLFSGEERTGMVPILRSTKYGRASLLKCKLGAAVMITTVLWILFQLVMLLIIALTYTLRGATCTVLLFNGKPSIYGLNWMTYYLLQCAYSYLGTLVFTLFICCLSSILPLRLSMPLDLTITLLTGIPMNHFCYADQAFDLLDKCRAMMPSQLMAAHPTLQVYQSYAFGNVIIQLPYVTAAAILIESGLLLWFLRKRQTTRT